MSRSLSLRHAPLSEPSLQAHTSSSASPAGAHHDCILCALQALLRLLDAQLQPHELSLSLSLSALPLQPLCSGGGPLRPWHVAQLRALQWKAQRSQCDKFAAHLRPPFEALPMLLNACS